ncbi:hypothetical protein [Kaarinaea lacus]
MEGTTSTQHFQQLLSASGQSRSAKTVEVFGWIILAESTFILFAPHFVASVLYMPDLNNQASNFFRLAGLLVGGLGMLYIASGRLNATGFVFASLLDRPLVPVIMLVLWYLDIIPLTLALAFALQDGISFFWTLIAWKSEHRGS